MNASWSRKDFFIAFIRTLESEDLLEESIAADNIPNDLRYACLTNVPDLIGCCQGTGEVERPLAC
jgi:hypothetical protein